MSESEITNERIPLNTSRRASDCPESVLAGMLTHPNGTSGFIEGQEAAAQVDACQSDTLPNQGSDDPAWAKMGIVFGEVVEGDSLFRHCTMPNGWKKVPTDHSMWNNVVDDKGRVRGRYFYKGAFYDRDAFISPCYRFTFSKMSEELDRQEYGTETLHSYAVILDEITLDGNGKPTVIFETEHREHNRRDYDAVEGIKLVAEQWMAENYPDWKDASAYWNE